VIQIKVGIEGFGLGGIKQGCAGEQASCGQCGEGCSFAFDHRILS
jgi:hypothetical protein